jgi:hypothetical protein
VVALAALTTFALAPVVALPWEVVFLFALVSWPVVLIAGQAIWSNYRGKGKT